MTGFEYLTMYINSITNTELTVISDSAEQIKEILNIKYKKKWENIYKGNYDKARFSEVVEKWHKLVSDLITEYKTIVDCLYRDNKYIYRGETVEKIFKPAIDILNTDIEKKRYVVRRSK